MTVIDGAFNASHRRPRPIVVGIYELLPAGADSDDRLPERELRLISKTDLPEDRAHER